MHTHKHESLPTVHVGKWRLKPFTERKKRWLRCTLFQNDVIADRALYSRSNRSLHPVLCTFSQTKGRGESRRMKLSLRFTARCFGLLELRVAKA